MRDQGTAHFVGDVLAGAKGGKPDVLADLAALQGLELGEDLVLRSTAAACRHDISPSTPIYTLPVGVAKTFPVELHLRPSDVKGGRLAFLSVEGPATRIEIASSPRHLLYLTLLRLESAAEAAVDEDDLRSAQQRAGTAFGSDFYIAGEHGEFDEADAGELAAKRFGMTPTDALEAALFAVELEEKVAILERGVAQEPGCLELHAKLAFRHRDGGDVRAAARSVASALHCFHHTAYSVDLAALYDLGRSLLAKVPEAFDDVTRRDLETTEERARLRWVTEAYDADDVELATKLLCDMCHERQDYESVLELFHKHFERLGWEWGVALCDLRR